MIYVLYHLLVLFSLHPPRMTTSEPWYSSPGKTASFDELVNALQVLVGALEELRRTPEVPSEPDDPRAPGIRRNNVDHVAERVLTAVRRVRESLLTLSQSGGATTSNS